MSSPDVERERFALILFYTLVVLIGYLAFEVVGPFLVPLAWAAILAMVVNPVRGRLAKRIGGTAASVATTLLTFLIIVVPAVIVGTLLVHEVSTQLQTVAAPGAGLIATPARIQQAWDSLRAQVPVLQLPTDPTSSIQGAVSSVATYAASSAASILTNIAGFLAQLFITLFALFFFLRDRTAVVGTIRQLLPFEPARRDRIINQTYELVVATVGATFTVALAQGALTGITLAALGFSAPIFWGVMTSFASIVPVAGASLVWGPAAIWLFVTGDIMRGVILVAVGIGVISMADNLLRPLLLSGRTTMHGLLVFISLLGGVVAFGFIGLVLGPVVVATMETLLAAVVQPPAGGKAAS